MASLVYASSSRSYGPRTMACPDTENFDAFLDRITEELHTEGADHHAAMDRLSDGLWWFRHEQSATWPDLVARALQHPLREIVREDPFTRHSFDQPRGYAGDAALLDYIYYDQSGVDLTRLTGRGREIYRRNRDAPAPRAVRERRDHLAYLIDRTAIRRPGARILAVACGHLREGLLSHALAASSLASRSGEGRPDAELSCHIEALDQDPRSLEEVMRCFRRGVTVRSDTIRSLLGAPVAGERHDLIYAAGLYDYLNDRTAARLTSRLFERLMPEGELVVANFVPDVADAGYMESYMGWRLLGRTLEQVHAFGAELPQSVITSSATYQLTTPDIAYLKVHRD